MAFLRRNFRLNGPEDARILNLHSTTYFVIYAEHAGNNRRQFFRLLHGYQTLSKETELTSSNLNAVEKNWVPFLDADQRPHVWRWLEDEDGYGVAHLIHGISGHQGNDEPHMKSERILRHVNNFLPSVIQNSSIQDYHAKHLIYSLLNPNPKARMKLSEVKVQPYAPSSHCTDACAQRILPRWVEFVVAHFPAQLAVLIYQHQH